MIENLKELVPYNVLIGDENNTQTHLIEVHEEWRDIYGYEGYYAISNFGRVKSFSRILNTKGGTRTKKEQILATRTDSDGYPVVVFCVDNVKKNQKVHRLVATYFIENKFLLPQVNHKQGNKKDNRYFSLEWIDNAGNIKHSYDIGTHKPTEYAGWFNGEKSYGSKLKEADVHYIRGNNGIISQRDLAKHFGVHFSTISAIVKRTTWKHI